MYFNLLPSITDSVEILFMCLFNYFLSPLLYYKLHVTRDLVYSQLYAQHLTKWVPHSGMFTKFLLNKHMLLLLHYDLI